MDALAAARRGVGTSPQSSDPHAPAARPPRQEQRGVVALPPSSVCCATSLKPVTELWPAGTSEEVMAHAIGSILLRFESMLQTEIHHDFWRLAEGFHYVPVLVWSDGSCQTEISSGMGPNGAGHGCQWWPMVINPWTPAWNIFGQIDPNLFWGMCPALAINGGRPWPVHKDRVRVLTNRILANCREAGKPEKVEKAETAPTPSEIDTSAPSESDTAAPSEIGTAASPSDSSWQAVTDPSSDMQSEFVFFVMTLTHGQC